MKYEAFKMRYDEVIFSFLIKNGIEKTPFQNDLIGIVYNGVKLKGRH